MVKILQVCIRDGLCCSRLRSCCEFLFAFVLNLWQLISGGQPRLLPNFYHLFPMTACDRWAAPTWPSSTLWATLATSGQSHSHSGKQFSWNKSSIPFLPRFVDQITWKQCTSDFGDLGNFYLFPFWQTLVKLQVRSLSKSLAGANIELCLYSVRKNLIRHFPGVSLANLNVTSLEHLGSPLARANLASLDNLEHLENLNVTSSLSNLGHLENLNATSAQQSLFNLTAIGSNFCHGTEQVCLKNWRYDYTRSLWRLWSPTSVRTDPRLWVLRACLTSPFGRSGRVTHATLK